MNDVVTSQPSSTFSSLTQLQVGHGFAKPQSQAKLDWATECATPVKGNNEEKNESGAHHNPDDERPSARSSGVSSKPSFPSPLTSDSARRSGLGWHRPGSQYTDDRNALSEGLVKMQIRQGGATAGSPPKTALDKSDVSIPLGGNFNHTRDSSTDTSSSTSSAAPLHINSAVPVHVKDKPFSAFPGSSRPKSFQESISDAERKRLQRLSPVNLQSLQSTSGPKTSPPREADTVYNVQSPDAATPASAQAPRYPSLQDQSGPTYPSIQQQQQHTMHRPPPISVIPGQGFRDARVEQTYPGGPMMDPRMPTSAGFTPRSVSDSTHYRPGGPRGGTSFAPPMAMGPGSMLGPAPPGTPGYPPFVGPSTPQMYEMVLPPVSNDVARSPFRTLHQHTGSDPVDVNATAAHLAMLGLTQTPGSMPGMGGPMQLSIPFGVGSPLPGPIIYGNQFYPPPRAEGPAYAGMPGTARQMQYSHGTTSGSAHSGYEGNGSQNASPTGSAGPQGPGGPSANNRKLGLYKTELCRSWEEKGSCRYGPKCQFAHGEDELRKVSRHPKYKTEICRTFWVSGSCPYGKRCCFIHTELPDSDGASAAAAATQQAGEGSAAEPSGGRPRSGSLASDPPDPVSILARIKRTPEAVATASPIDPSTSTEGSSTPTYHYPAQRPGPLRVDTAVVDPKASFTQHRSAFPTFAKNAPQPQPLSPGPVTAGPDLGRAARFEVGYTDGIYSQNQTPTTAQPTPLTSQGGQNPLRHSFNGTESLNIKTQIALASSQSPPKFGVGSQAPAAVVGGGDGLSGSAQGHGLSGSGSSAHSRSESQNSSSPWNGFGRPMGGLAPKPNSPWSGDSMNSNKDAWS